MDESKKKLARDTWDAFSEAARDPRLGDLVCGLVERHGFVATAGALMAFAESMVRGNHLSNSSGIRIDTARKLGSAIVSYLEKNGIEMP